MTKGEAIKVIFKKLKLIKKKYIILNLIIITILVIGVVIIFNNYRWYDTTIVKIEKVENSLTNESKESSNREKYYDQVLIGTVMNGEHLGQKAYLKNKYSSSGVLNDKYKTGNEVFVKVNLGDSKKITGIITGLKRDKYMATLLAIFILLLINVTKMKGFFSFISVSLNIAILWYALNLNYNGYNILIICNCLVLFFTFGSLIFISGFKKKTFVAILSTLISLCFTMLLFKILMACTEGVDYTYMGYITGQNYQGDLFMSQMLIGGLGAIMDVAITEASAINELVSVDNGISLKDLMKSGREVGHDIMGTMINIMLFTYVCGIIPLIILKMKNNVKLHTIIIWQIPTELFGFIIGSIGILLTIPISLSVSILIFKKVGRFI